MPFDMRLPSGRLLSVNSLVAATFMLIEIHFKQDGDEHESIIEIEENLTSDFFRLNGNELKFDSVDTAEIVRFIAPIAQGVYSAIMNSLEKQRPIFESVIGMMVEVHNTIMEKEKPNDYS